jgi:hypothetical protein
MNRYVIFKEIHLIKLLNYMHNHKIIGYERTKRTEISLFK